MVIEVIIPTTKIKWLQVNAESHISQRDVECQQVYDQDSFTFDLIQQPPDSPDLNILDLGFFRTIQS